MESNKFTEFEIEKELENEILYSAIESELSKENNLKKVKVKKKRKLRFKKEIKIRTLLLLIVTLIMNTYAWFIYISTVSVGISMHIKNWNFDFQDGATVARAFDFYIDEIYPGVPLEDTIQNIDATNGGETDAYLTCKIKYIRILDKEYSTSAELAEETPTQLYTSDELLTKLYEDYPFKIQILIVGEDEFGEEVVSLYDGDDIDMPSLSVVKVRFQVVWPYEMPENQLISTHTTLIEADEEDTYWGEEAYSYHQDNSDKYSVVVKIELQANQKEEEGTSSNPSGD